MSETRETRSAPQPATAPAQEPGLGVVLREWGRIGCIGFGGPPAHIALLRDLCVERRRWLSAREFEDAIAATNLLPGPASTQLAIYSAWRLGGVPGALVGGLSFIVPGLVLILGLAALFLAASPPDLVLGAGAGAGAAVAAVALQASAKLAPASWRRAASRPRWIAYGLAGVVAGADLGPLVVLVLLGCGALEVIVQRSRSADDGLASVAPWPLLAAVGAASGGLLALAWVAFKVGALSYGGGFVIIPLMQHDAVDTYRWMTDAQFLNAVALGQVTPGPVVHTVAVVGYAAGGVGGGLLAALVAFAPSFAMVLVGAPRFDRLRASPTLRAFLDGAGPAAIGAIAGAAIPLALALSEAWQLGVLAAAAVALFVLHRGVVVTLIAAGAAGALAAALSAPLPS
ncbi:MAG TPA: chromate efflux transporter [Solirubrobacteraceae bacterium]